MSETEVIKSKAEKQLYRETLQPTERARYIEKLKLLDEQDPYELNNLSPDVHLLPAVTYPDIVNYLVYSPSPYTLEDLKCYKGLEAYNQFICGWVSGVSSVVIQDKHLVKARVLHSQRLREKPLSPWIVAEKNGKIISSHCDCMAGLGETCTHVAALLFSIEGTVKIRDSRTVTQEPAYWLLPASIKTASYRETRSIDFSAAKMMKKRFDQQINTPMSATPTPMKKIKSKVPAPTAEELKHFFRNLEASGRKPAILSVIPEHANQFVPAILSDKFPTVLTQLKESSAMSLNYKDLLEKCSNIQVTVSEEEAKNVEMATKKQSNCTNWYQFRAGRITASNMKAACVTDPANPAQSLVKSICYPASSRFTNAATKWGIANESVARTKLKQMLKERNHDNLQVEECGLYISPEHSYLAASPDGMVSCDCCGRGCIEIKCPYSLRGQMISDNCDFLVPSDDGKLRLDSNHAYYYQVQAQMGVTRTDYAYFVVWTDVDMHIELILLNIELYEDLCKRSSHLFRLAILPELVGKFYTRLPGSDYQSKCQDQSPVAVAPLQAPTSQHEKTASRDTEERWCYCDQVESGKMIGCDNQNCSIVWFHFTCLKLTAQPKSKIWYCPECRRLPEFVQKRKKVRR